jgi:DNA mismatch repair protein MutS2
MHALRVLEFEEIRQRLARHCETSVGQALAHALSPSFDPEVVKIWNEQTGEAIDLIDSGGLSLRGLHDLSKSLDYCRKGGVLEGVLIFQTSELLRLGREAKKSLESKRERMPRLGHLATRLFMDSRLEDRLANSVESDGTVKSDASPGLASARERKARLAQRVQERINSYVSGKTREWLSDPVVTQRSGRWVIPLKAENKGKIKGIVHDTSGSGGTIYVEPDDVVRLGNELREAEGQERSEIEKVLRKLSELIALVAEPLINSAEALGQLDLILGKARLGIAGDWCLPTLLPDPAIIIRNGRHPLLDAKIAVPLSLELGREHTSILITGPNTGGKTISIKTVGLFVAMTQSGLPVPAGEVKAGVFSQIWADIGDEQSLQQSLSTFSAHIKNIAEAVDGLKKGALILLDEIGAGTDPAEGAALARALLLDFQKRGAIVMASTHYGELKLFAANTPGFINSSMEFDRKTLRPTYRLMVGVPGSSHALHIAQRYGIPTRVLDEAERSGPIQEKDISNMIEQLEISQKRAQASQSRADKLAAELKRVQTEAETKLKQAEEIRQNVRGKAVQELEELLRQIRLEAASVFEEVKKDPAKGMERARKKLAELQEVGSSFVQEMKPVEKAKPALKPAEITRGMAVHVRDLKQSGTVLEEPKGGKVLVQIGMMKMTVPVAHLTPGQVRKESAKPNEVRKLTMHKASTAKSEINLINKRAEEAQDELERFLDDAILGGLPYVRIVHGKGEGILRQVVSNVLERNPHVKGHKPADGSGGGAGVTLADLG